MATVRPWVLRGAYLLTLATGASGLVYQVVWQRFLGRLLGNDHLATATTLGVFLAGLSLGYFLFGRVSSRVRRPLIVYGWVEALICGWALAFPWLFGVARAASESWNPASRPALVFEGTALGVLLIGPPTVGMGATLPLLMRGLCGSLHQATRVQSLIYGINTLGAAFGALAAAFLTIHTLGLPGSLRVAALGNLAAALFFLLAGRRGNAPSPPQVARLSTRRHRGAASRPDRAALPLYAIALLSGFYVMTLESVLVRFLGLSVGHSGLALAIVVSVFVLCIAAGALVVGALRSPAPWALACNQALAGVGLMLLFVTLDKWPYWAHLLRLNVPPTDAGFWVYHVALFGALFVLLMLPVGCMGATLPLAFDLLKRDFDDIGRDVGALYGWNAAGSLLGGVGGGYLLQRWLLNGEIVIVVLGLTAVSLLLAARWVPRERRRWSWIVALAALLFAGAFPAHDPLRFAVGTFRLRGPLPYSRQGPQTFYDGFFRARQVLAYRDDPEGTFSVVQNPFPTEALAREFPSLAGSIYADPALRPGTGTRPRAIVVNGKTDSNTHYDRETLALLAHVPALLAERRETVLLVGLGTGVTAGELTLYRDVSRIDVVEIAPGVDELLPWFDDANRGVRNDPRLHVKRGDAFRVIGRSSSRWDLILSQPSNPWVAGQDQLFSREFYRTVREHLAPRGLFLQWSQRYAATEEMVALVLRTLSAEFEHVRVFAVGADDLLLASAHPLTDEAFDSADRLLRDDEAVRLALAGFGVRGSADLLARERREAVSRALRLGTHLETLDRPRLQPLAARAFFRGESLDAE